MLTKRISLLMGKRPMRQCFVTTRTARLTEPARISALVRASSDHPSYVMKPMTTEIELEAERVWLTTAMTTWLDEEWTSLPEHRQLAQAAADAYVTLRQRGEDDMGAVVLAVASELMRPELSAAFHASFTEPFEVSNKLCETVMLKDGCDVCCTSDSDRERIQRVNAMMSSGSL